MIPTAEKLPLGTRVRLRTPLFPQADGKTGEIVRHVRRRSFDYGVKLDKPVYVRTRRKRRSVTEQWREVHARADEVEVM